MFKSFFRKKSIDQIQRDYAESSASPHAGLHKVLGVRDLTFLGIAAVVGAGIFSTIGGAAYQVAPGFPYSLSSRQSLVAFLHYVMPNLPVGYPLPVVHIHILM